MEFFVDYRVALIVFELVVVGLVFIYAGLE